MIKLNWKPQKGKAFEKLPKKTLDTFNLDIFSVSTKYDGNQIFISKYKDTVRFFTSDWKEFYFPSIASLLASTLIDYVLVAECNYGEGKKGERTIIQGLLTTERTNFKKGLPCSLDESKLNIKVFDIVEFDKNGIINNYVFSKRLNRLERLLSSVTSKNISMAKQKLMCGLDAITYTKELVSAGWEGTMLMSPYEYYFMGKRVNHSIKIKFRPSADLECIDVTIGTGKYTGMIGALVLKDKQGRVVSVGSGLSDIDRAKPSSYFIGKIIEIEYEQLMDTYQQPTYQCIREDKTKGE